MGQEGHRGGQKGAREGKKGAREGKKGAAPFYFGLAGTLCSVGTLKQSHIQNLNSICQSM